MLDFTTLIKKMRATWSGKSLQNVVRKIILSSHRNKMKGRLEQIIVCQKPCLVKIVDINITNEWKRVSHCYKNAHQSWNYLQPVILQTNTLSIIILCMAIRTSREYLKWICNVMVKLYGKELLHIPTSHNIALLYQAHEDK